VHRLGRDPVDGTRRHRLDVAGGDDPAVADAVAVLDCPCEDIRDRLKSALFEVARARSFTRAIAAICPSMKGGVLPAAASLARERAIQRRRLDINRRYWLRPIRTATGSPRLVSSTASPDFAALTRLGR
jgi:hypothetical protein